MKNKVFFFLLIISSGIFTFLLFTHSKDAEQYKISLSTIKQVSGKLTLAMSRATARSIPVNSIDEKELGDEIYSKLKNDSSALRYLKENTYLANLIGSLTQQRNKSFKYRVLLIESSVPNAFAFPGGVITITTGLLNSLESESELVAILAHEMGHIELSHCMDSVKYQLLSNKILTSDIGKIADFAHNIILANTFNQNQEKEADDYSFEFLKQSIYSPMGLSNALVRLQKISKNEISHPIRDYFSSHPPLAHRIISYKNDALHWNDDHPNLRRYIGNQNIKERISFSEKTFAPNEWT